MGKEKGIKTVHYKKSIDLKFKNDNNKEKTRKKNYTAYEKQLRKWQ